MTKGKKLLLAFGAGALLGFVLINVIIAVAMPTTTLPPNGTYLVSALWRNGATFWGEASYHVEFYTLGGTTTVKLPSNAPLIGSEANKLVVENGQATIYTSGRSFTNYDYPTTLIYLGVAVLIFLCGFAIMIIVW